MAVDKFIHEREAFHPDHPGMHSHLRGIQSSDARIQEFLLFDARTQRIAAHESGTTIGNQEVGSVVLDQWTPPDWEAIQEIRAELKAMCE